MKRFAQAILLSAHDALLRIVEPDAGQLKPVPNIVLSLTVFLSVNVLLQGIADVLLKFLSYTPILPSLPWRTDFLFLTAISVLMGYRTLTGMRQRKFDVTRNSIELGFLVETALVVGDTEFVLANLDHIPSVLVMRLPFIVLTIVNIGILAYSYHVLKLTRWPHLKRSMR